jgi:hypothetical protein
MKALTLTQPWATLVALGEKQIETRSWKTPYRGPLAIHSAKGFPEDCEARCYEEPFYTALGRPNIITSGIDLALDPILPRGFVLATCKLVGCVKTDYLQRGKPIPSNGWPSTEAFELTEDEWAFGDYSPGRWAWLLADISMLSKPIAARGYQFLWEWVAQP